MAPGAIRTPINTSAWDTPEAEAELLRLIPYRRVGDPGDIATAVTLLASDLMDYVVGTTIYVDGGMTLSPAAPPEADPFARAETSIGSPRCPASKEART